MESKDKKILVVLIFILGIYIGFNLGLEKALWLAAGLTIGFFVGRLNNEDKDGKWSRSKRVRRSIK